MKQDSNKQRIFITGGAGFVGSNLTRYLLEQGRCQVTVYDNLSSGSKATLDKAIADSGQNDSLKFVQADILDFESLSRAMAGHDVVVHLAAHTQVRESIKNPEPHLAVNSTGTFNVIEAARQQNVDKFVFASSNAAVGEQIPPINETMIPKPLSPYGAVKLYGEALCSAYHCCYGLKTASLRFANVYGPYSDHKTSVIAKFLKRIKEDKGLEIYGDGLQTRDFVHASDISQAIHLVITHNNSGLSTWGEVFQIASGTETSIIDLAKMLISFTNRSEQDISFTDPMKGEIRKNFSDISKANKILGYSPQMKLDTQLKMLCATVG